MQKAVWFSSQQYVCDTYTSYEWTWLYPLPTGLATQSRAKSKNIYSSGALSLIFKIKPVLNPVVSRIKFFSLKVTKMPTLLPQYQLGPLFLYFFIFFFFSNHHLLWNCTFWLTSYLRNKSFWLAWGAAWTRVFPITLSSKHPTRIPPFVMLEWPWPDSKGAVHI